MSDPTAAPAGGMFDKLKGKAKQVVGQVTGNEDLKTEGHLQEKTSDAARDAKQAEVRAEQEQAEADVDAALAENEIETQRLQTEQAAAARQAEVERDAERTEQQLEQQIDQREKAVEEQAARERSEAARAQVAAAQDRAKAESQRGAHRSYGRPGQGRRSRPARSRPGPLTRPDEQETTMPIDISTLPRSAVEGWLGVVRLPVTAAAVVTRHAQDESWPPALAFDAFEARFKAIAASVLHDDKLADAAEAGQQPRHPPARRSCARGGR